MSGSSQALDATNTTGGRTPSMKRRRNASGVWEYICKTTRKCKVKSCIVKHLVKTQLLLL
jgi:hypothetical protein